MNAVHKRLHASQAEEFKLLVECFKENPESFWQRKCKSQTKWDEKTFIDAINNCELVPQADPNTASHSQRVMKIMALKQLQAANPSMYNPIAIDMAALQAIGYSNPQQFLAPPEAQQSPPPELQQLMAKMQNEKDKTQAKIVEAQARMTDSQAKVAEVQAKIQQGAFAPKQQTDKSGGSTQIDTEVDKIMAQAKLMDAQTKRAELGIKHHDSEDEAQNRALDRQSREKIQVMELARDIIMHNTPSAEVQNAIQETKKDVGE